MCGHEGKVREWCARFRTSFPKLFKFPWSDVTPLGLKKMCMWLWCGALSLTPQHKAQHKSAISVEHARWTCTLLTGDWIAPGYDSHHSGVYVCGHLCVCLWQNTLHTNNWNPLTHNISAVCDSFTCMYESTPVKPEGVKSWFGWFTAFAFIEQLKYSTNSQRG